LADGITAIAGSSIAEIPASELWLFRNPEAINDVREGLRDAAQRQTKFSILSRI
jgi:hypothetical protein